MKKLPQQPVRKFPGVRRGLQLFAVEPRMLFDGAAVPTAEACHDGPPPQPADSTPGVDAKCPPVPVDCAPASGGHGYHGHRHGGHDHDGPKAGQEKDGSWQGGGEQSGHGQPAPQDINHDPVANADQRTIAAGDVISDGQVILGNGHGDVADSDVDGNDLIVTGLAAGSTVDRGSIGEPIAGEHGTLTMREDGSYTYVPHAGLSLAQGESVHDVFSYLLCDQAGAEARTTLTVVVVGVAGGGSGGTGSDGGDGGGNGGGDGGGNHPPTAEWDHRSLSEDEVITDGQAILGNAFGDHADHDVEPGPLTATGIAHGWLETEQSGGIGQPIQGQWGTLVLQGDGSYTYTPNEAAQHLAAGEVVRDYFTYTISDQDGLTSTSWIKFDVIGANDAPIAVDDARGIDRGSSITDGAAIVGNAFGDNADSDIDRNDTLSVTGVVAGNAGAPGSGSVGQPVTGQYGTLTLNGDGSYTYVPNSAGQSVPNGQTANDVFTYTISDGNGGTDHATITITLNGDGSGGGNHPPTAEWDHRSLSEDEVITDGQ
ncbi:MAG TPA: Ig-like domain-containing protein, partial [Burkholderiaceae bacterium]|nr:Ig-like domain-containing protein [Burkholderiaceae bacterium]